MVFGFSIGINVTNAVFLGSPPPFGFGWAPFSIAGGYATPIVSLLFTINFTALRQAPQVSVLLGELIGRYVNDWIQNVSIRRNKGVFEAESRLW